MFEIILIADLLLMLWATYKFGYSRGKVDGMEFVKKLYDGEFDQKINQDRK